MPRGQDAEGHQECREQDEGHRNAIHAELEENGLTKPGLLLQKLEAGIGNIKAVPGNQRQNERRQSCDQRRPARIVLHRRAITAQYEKESRADKRQSNQAGENTEAEHQCTPPTRYHVMIAATPISMAKA